MALKAGAKAEGGEHANGELNTIGCLDIFGFEDFKHNRFFFFFFFPFFFSHLFLLTNSPPASNNFASTM